MKTAALGFAAFTVAALTFSSGAIAANCNGSADRIGNTVTHFWDLFVLDLNGGDTAQTCPTPANVAPNALSIPAGAVGYYRVSNYGYMFGPNGEVVKSTVDPDFAAPVSENFTIEDGEFVHEAYYVSGPRAGYDGTVTLELSGPGVDGQASLDTTDVAVYYTTTDELEGSLSQLAAGQTGLVTHLNAVGGLLTGADKPVEADGNQVGVIGGAGSYFFGVAANYSLGDGYNILGGASVVDLSATDAHANGVMGAFALRYVDPAHTGSFRLFGEGGVNVASLNASFTRSYISNVSPFAQSVTSTTDATLGSAYVRGGVLMDIDDTNELALSATVQGTAVGIAGYSEMRTAANPFPLTVPDQTGYFTTLKGTAAWTTEIASDFDLTADVSLGATMAHSPVSANVAFVGNMTGAPQNTLFAEYGLRLGWSPSDTTTIDGYVRGSTATVGGTHVQVGAGARMKF